LRLSESRKVVAPVSLVFIHSSDELYGTDRVLLDSLDALPAGQDAEVWLPTDITHPAAALCVEVERRGFTARHVDLPILRRGYRTAGALATLGQRTVRLRQRLRTARPDAIYCTTSATLLAAVVARTCRVPHVIGHVQEVWTANDRRVLTPLAARCHRLIANSNAVVHAFPERLRARTALVPNATPEPRALSPLTGRTGPLRYLIASRWTERKGYRTLFEAWDRIETPGELVVLGGPPPIGNVVDVRALVSGLRRPESVTIVGEVADPEPYLDTADVILVPSDEPESFGLVAIEAFARGRPVVASATGGLVDIVTPGVDGWLFPPGDVDGLASILAGLERGQVLGAGSRARDTYEKRYTTESFRERWRSAVEGYLEPRKRSRMPG
jgi:glycosyltransferase involved in cell wall biosynthesis